MVLQSLPTSSGWRLFKIEGQLDFTGVPTVQTALCYVANRDACNLLIDLEDIRMADEKGLSGLVGAVRRVLSEHPRMRVAFVAPQEWLADGLARGDYSADIAVYHDGEEALKSISATVPQKAA
ncbi:MAG: hypothetical protein GIW99_11590 [Candidatus Eremiobacteraeota bacterium]|nr:hypothetical protein [Candidatus Eremiobacteraeota bacterium]MBC5828303.1 hypothetical protein [Candidatus Eremiobacteraeota bacterium]